MLVKSIVCVDENPLGFDLANLTSKRQHRLSAVLSLFFLFLQFQQSVEIDFRTVENGCLVQVEVDAVMGGGEVEPMPI